MSQEKVIAFFDFDGTLTKSDSFWHFLRYGSTPLKFATAVLILSPLLVRFKLGLISNLEAKPKVLKFFFEGMDCERFTEICCSFAKEKLPELLVEERVQLLKDHQNKGHMVCLVSASIADYLKPWCEQMNIGLLATKMKNVNGRFHAEYEYPNCWGPEKAKRIKEAYNLTEYEQVFAYGNSRGDKEMLELADYPTLFK